MYFPRAPRPQYLHPAIGRGRYPYRVHVPGLIVRYRGLTAILAHRGRMVLPRMIELVPPPPPPQGPPSASSE